MTTVSETAHAGATHDDHDGHGDAHPSFLQHHFDTPAQQFAASKLGMWVFIATEILMFGGLFCAYAITRALEPQVYDQSHHFLNKILGATNTIVLLFSSLTAALAVRSAQVGKRNETSIYLVITILCACVFLVVKYFEYSHKFHLGLLPGHCFGHPGLSASVLPNGQEVGTCLRMGANPDSVTPLWVRAIDESGHEQLLPPRANMFFALYFVMTGLHGLHVIIGMSILTWVLIKNQQGKFSKAYFTPVDLGALYWHLVDLVWIYLFPLLYLVGKPE
ncbi:MAG TPA: cytochrome c oxidase subunit 3 family protein [Polyangiaceae bacterium]|nr:cytochrome c oxidase subunit 3 family protein [Polyangiaceae bacterium]